MREYEIDSRIVERAVQLPNDRGPGLLASEYEAGSDSVSVAPSSVPPSSVPPCLRASVRVNEEAHQVTAIAIILPPVRSLPTFGGSAETLFAARP